MIRTRALVTRNPPKTSTPRFTSTLLGVLLAGIHSAAVPDAVSPPPNAPALLDWHASLGRLRFALRKPVAGASVVLRGTVTASVEAFPAETAGAAQKRFPLVRNSVGLSHNLRNNAVYDRRWDWLLVGPDDTTRIQPQPEGREQTAFTWESRPSTSSGQEAIELVFRPRFYQKHRDLAKFEPWTYRVWKGPVTGYCTWWPYRSTSASRRWTRS